MKSKYGVYAYINTYTGEVKYIGYDSNIDVEKRHKDHYLPSEYPRQYVNQQLQDAPNGKYDYVVLAVCINKEVMKITENALITQFKPEFNTKINKKEVSYDE